VLEEADESLYWLEIIVETEVMPQDRLGQLMEEAGQLISMFVAGLNTAKGN
jgi:four helix bundle protein